MYDFQCLFVIFYTEDNNKYKKNAVIIFSYFKYLRRCSVAKVVKIKPAELTRVFSCFRAVALVQKRMNKK